jgi:hypothetical protein
MREFIFTYTNYSNTAPSASIYTKLKNAQQHCVQISFSKLRRYRTTNAEIGATN